MRVYDKKIRFTPRGPWIKGRRSYSLLRDEKNDSGPRIYSDVEDDRIEALTKEYKDALRKVMPARELAELVRIGKLTMDAIKKDHEKKVSRHLKHIPLSAYNQEILESYIKTKVRVKTANRVGSLRSDTFHAHKCIRLLGSNSLKTVEIEIIQSIMDSSKSEGENKHLIQNFRRLLKFVGRYPEADRLRRKRFQETKPPYLTREQVEILAKTVPERILVKHPLLPELIRIIFNLGARVSEALAIEKASVKKAEGHVVIVIDKQWARAKDSKADGSDRLRATKNNTKRAVLPVDADETLECLTKWLKALPKVADRETYRWSIDNYLRTACKQRFGVDIEDAKSESFFDFDSLPDLEQDRKYKAAHMLRAGHAVHMMALTHDNSAFVAKQLGDSEDVVRRHYSGRTNRPTSIAEVAKMLKKAN